MRSVPIPPPAARRALLALWQARDDLDQAVKDARAAGAHELAGALRSLLCGTAGGAFVLQTLLRVHLPAAPPYVTPWPAPAGADGLYLLLAGGLQLAEGLLERLEAHCCAGGDCPQCDWQEVAGQAVLLVQIPRDALAERLPSRADVETLCPKLLGLARTVLAGTGAAEGPLDRAGGDWRGHPPGASPGG